MKLELKHLAPYLPHKLPVQNKIGERVELKGENVDILLKFGNPILRPLSDLYGTCIINQQDNVSFFIEHNGNELVMESSYGTPLLLVMRDIDKLFENHFDVFGLIDAGLAIDINTI